MERTLTTNQKGGIAENAVTAEALVNGIMVYRPMSEGGRYDMIFDIQGRLMRVQCKWATRDGDVVTVRPYSSRRTADGMLNRRYTADEIDAVAAYCHDLGRSYLLPASLVCGRRAVHLRLAPSRNNQERRINWAKDYELGAIAQLGERLAGSQKVAGSSPASSTSKPPNGRLHLF
jgi:hypothetical protein